MARRKPPVAQSEPIDAEFEEGTEPDTSENAYPVPIAEEFYPPPQGPMARLNINTSIPVENLARLAAPAEPAPAPAPAPTTTPAPPVPEPDAAQRYLEDVKRENKLRAYIYRMPDRLPLLGLPERLPKDRRGWVHYGALPFNPDEFESEIQATFPPGNYWIDIREGGQFRAKEIISVAANPLQLTDQPHATPTPTPQTPVGQMMPAFYPAPEANAPNPEKQVKALLDVAKQLISLQPAAPPVPTLAERLEELKLLQKMLTPPPSPAAANPLEELVAVVRSEAFKEVKKLLRNPESAPADTGGWQDIIKTALPYVLPAVAPLLQVVATNAARNLATQQRAAAPVTPQPPAPAAQSQQLAPPPAPAPAPNPAPSVAPVTEIKAETETEKEEETGEENMPTLTPLQQLVVDLAHNRAPSEVAEDITQAIGNDMLAKMQIKMLMKMSNAEIFEMVRNEGIPQDVLEQIAWREEWLDQLRESLKTHFA